MATLIKKLSMTSGPGFEIWTRVIEDGDVTTELLIASEHKDVERMNGAGVSQSFKAQKRFIKKVPKSFRVSDGGCEKEMSFKLFSNLSSSSQCYKTYFGGNQENLDLPVDWNSKIGNLKSNNQC